tara:strand:+ start:5674 stop:7515 length:1842 start_codon:yes stop_codon:yes gene_type:complete
MCGIISCLNCKDQINILLEGLNQLQNRGYDSCGICIIKDDCFEIQKYASTNTEQAISKLRENINLPESNIGIAHTRWATHGSRTNINAHPHIDFKNRVSLVHNGIITNYLSLKNRLIKDGFSFNSETDTEIISNLISFYLEKEYSPFDAFKKAISELEGSWGLVVMIKDKPNSLFISKYGSPLLLGKTEAGIIVGSEINVFGNMCSRIISLDEGELIEINSENVNNVNGGVSSISEFFKTRKILSQQEVCVQKTPYPFSFWMIKEIIEQPISVQKTLNYGTRISEGRITLNGLSKSIKLLENRNELIILGCGTSLNAGLWGSYIIKRNNIFKNVKIIDASEFEIYEIDDTNNCIFVVLSQSGETKDVHRCMVKVKPLNIPIIGIVNVVDSLISRDSDCRMSLNAGREVSVASTKSFVCQQIALTLLSLWFQERNNKCDSFSNETIHELQYISSHIENVLTNIEQFKQIAKELVPHNSCFLLGKNIFEPIAREGALKLKEIGYIHAEAFSGGSLKHGPFSLIEDGTPIILFIMDDIYKDFMMSTLEEVKSRGANCIVISNLEINIKNLIKIPKIKNLGSILSIIPLQIIAYEMALLKGHNPDYPRNLAKVVTVD